MKLLFWLMSVILIKQLLTDALLEQFCLLVYHHPSPCWPSVMLGSKTIKYLLQRERQLAIISRVHGCSYSSKALDIQLYRQVASLTVMGTSLAVEHDKFLVIICNKCNCSSLQLHALYIWLGKVLAYSTVVLLNSWKFSSSIQCKILCLMRK